MKESYEGRPGYETNVCVCIWTSVLYAHNALFPAGTQTVLTIPLNCDLEGLLGSAFYQPEEENNRDLGNTSLRRKLFGKPEKQQLGQQSEHMEVSPNLSPVRVVEGTPAEGTPYVYR